MGNVLELRIKVLLFFIIEVVVLDFIIINWNYGKLFFNILSVVEVFFI